MARLRPLLTLHPAPDTPDPVGRLAQCESPEEHQRVVQLVVEQHLGLADGLARQYAHRGVDLDDLVQVARLGLLLAAERYRPGVGESFPAFAVPTIRGEIKRHFRDHAWMVRPPRRIQELRARSWRARAELEQRYGHAPSTAELAEELHVDPHQVDECDMATTSFRPLSLDATTTTLDSPLSERLGADAPQLEDLADLLTLRRELRHLTARERRIVTWRFADGLTQTEIGERLGVSQMQVSRLLSGILAQLRSALNPTPVLAANAS